MVHVTGHQQTWQPASKTANVYDMQAKSELGYHLQQVLASQMIVRSLHEGTLYRGQTEAVDGLSDECLQCFEQGAVQRAIPLQLIDVLCRRMTAKCIFVCFAVCPSNANCT